MEEAAPFSNQVTLDGHPKPTVVIHQRFEHATPQRFVIVTLNCGQRRSKWLLCDYFGRVIIEPTTVEHNAGCLTAMTQQIQAACEAEGIVDCITADEMTGAYHKPIVMAFQKAEIETRIVHPFPSSHYRKPLHPDNKTDDNDLEAIFHAAINGYGLSILPVDETHLALQRLTRHRRNLAKQRSRIQVQVRAMMHQSMPGYADFCEDDKLFNKSIGMPIPDYS